MGEDRKGVPEPLLASGRLVNSGIDSATFPKLRPRMDAARHTTKGVLPQPLPLMAEAMSAMAMPSIGFNTQTSSQRTGMGMVIEAAFRIPRLTSVA
jgi:hypothetical protein